MTWLKGLEPIITVTMAMASRISTSRIGVTIDLPASENGPGLRAAIASALRIGSAAGEDMDMEIRPFPSCRGRQ